MGWETPTRISYAKQAAKTFVDQLNGSRDMAGLTSFGWDGTIDHQLSNNFPSVKSEIDDLVANGATNMGEGLEKANDEFVAHHREEALQAIILLSDGLVNVDRLGNFYDEEDDRTPAMNYVREEADVAEDMGVIIYTIGLGDESSHFDEDLLKEIVRNGGNYYRAPSAEDLVNIYEMIALDLLFQVQYEIVKINLTLVKAG
jgi:Ca-activated chloride channel family protein